MHTLCQYQGFRGRDRLSAVHTHGRTRSTHTPAEHRRWHHCCQAQKQEKRRQMNARDRRTCQCRERERDRHTRTSAAKRERTQLSTRAADFTAECGSSRSKTSRTGAELRLTLSLGAANGVENGLPDSQVLVSLLNKSLLPPPSPPSRGAAKRKRCCMGSVQQSVPAVVEQAPGGRARRRLVFYAAA